MYRPGTIQIDAMEEDKTPTKVTDIPSAQANIEDAVASFVQRWMPAPKFGIGVEVMDQGQLRDAMGLRATIDLGDPWPSAERQLIDSGFRWQWLNGLRVMYLKEKDDYVPDTGWQYAEEYEE